MSDTGLVPEIAANDHYLGNRSGPYGKHDNNSNHENRTGIMSNSKRNSSEGDVSQTLETYFSIALPS